jgi:hypothetical protein
MVQLCIGCENIHYWLSWVLVLFLFQIILYKIPIAIHDVHVSYTYGQHGQHTSMVLYYHTYRIHGAGIYANITGVY